MPIKGVVTSIRISILYANMHKTICTQSTILNIIHTVCCQWHSGPLLINGNPCLYYECCICSITCTGIWCFITVPPDCILSLSHTQVILHKTVKHCDKNYKIVLHTFNMYSKVVQLGLQHLLLYSYIEHHVFMKIWCCDIKSSSKSLIFIQLSFSC